MPETWTIKNILKICRLNTKLHERSLFDCEEPSLTNYLKSQANQDAKKLVAACFVLIDNHVVANGKLRIVGYYTLSNHSIGKEDIPDKYRKQLPFSYTTTPVTLLGRLARDISCKGQGYGEHLLLHALRRSYLISVAAIGSVAVVVDPIGQKAIDFYDKYGFILIPDTGRMFLPMSGIAKLFPPNPKG